MLNTPCMTESSGLDVLDILFRCVFHVFFNVHVIFINFHFIKCILKVNLTHYFCGLVQGLIAGDSISPDKQKVSEKEGASVTLRCTYETSSDYVDL